MQIKQREHTKVLFILQTQQQDRHIWGEICEVRKGIWAFFVDCAFRMLIGCAGKLRSHGCYTTLRLTAVTNTTAVIVQLIFVFCLQGNYCKTLAILNDPQRKSCRDSVTFQTHLNKSRIRKFCSRKSKLSTRGQFSEETVLFFVIVECACKVSTCRPYAKRRVLIFIVHKHE